MWDALRKTLKAWPLRVGCVALVISAAAPAFGQTAGSLIWEAQGYTDQQAIPPTTQFTSGGATTTVNWTATTDGGLTAYSGDDFVSYGGSTRGGTFGNLELGFNNDQFDLDDNFTTDLEFNVGLDDLQFTILDVDEANWHDVIEVYFDTGTGWQNAALFPAYWTLGGARVALDNETYATGWEGVAGNAGGTDATANIIFDFTGATVWAVRAVYFGGDDYAGNPNGQVSGFSDLTYTVPAPAGPQDHSDAPLTGTLYGNAIHPIVTGVQLGASNTAELAGYDTTAANGDSDDGITLPVFYQGQPTSITADVSGVGGYLSAWIDWNDDGDFDDSEEQVATDLQDTDLDGTLPIPIIVPASASLTQTIARFRWSTTSGLSYASSAADGEVEDYAITPVTYTAPTPFSCDGTLYQVAESTSTLKRLNIIESGGSYAANLVDVGGVAFQVNAGWGFNELDDMIYGVKNGAKELWRIDSDGDFFQMPIPADALSQNGSNAGDILPDGTMVYKRNNGLWVLVDLTDPYNPIELGTVTISPSTNSVDFGLNPFDGKIYSVDRTSDRLYYVDITALSAGTSVTPQYFGPTTYDGGYGASWFDEDGNFYLYNNDNNQILMVDVGTNGNGTGAAILLATSSNDEGGINDGAYCRGPSAVPLGGVSGTVYGDADGSDVMDGSETGLGADITIDLYYDNNTSGDLSDDVLYKTGVSAADGTYDFSSLFTVGSFRAQLNESDPDILAGATLGTTNPLTGISVIANAITTDQDFGFDLPNSELDGSKTVEIWDPLNSGLYALPGNDVIYTISVTNMGALAADANSIELIDILPPEIKFWNGDLESGGADVIAGTDPIGFVQSTGAGLTFDYTTDVRFSTGTTPPADFAACTVTAIDNSYRSDLTYICINPKGALAGSLDPDPDPYFQVSFRAQIK